MRINKIFLMLILSMFISTVALASNQDTNAPSETIDNHTLVPVREIFETMGSDVTWQNSSKSIIITNYNERITLQVGSNRVNINGKEIILDSPVVAIKGNTFVPTKFVAESFEYNKDSEVETDTIIINDKDNNDIYNFKVPKQVAIYLAQRSIKANDIFESKTIIPTLLYHHFVEVGDKTGGATITNKEFKEQIVYLKSKGYNTINDRDMFDFYYNGKELPKNPIHITMDDGYESNFKFAYPILKENNMKATIFLIVSSAEKKSNLSYLTWNQMKEMSDSGVMSIQSHTHDLHNKVVVDSIKKSEMVAGDSIEYHNKVKDDLMTSKKLIEGQLGNKVTSLAYPFGDYNQKNLSDVKEVGLKTAYTVVHGVNSLSTNPLELHRINITPGFTGESIHNEIIKQKNLIR